MKTKAVYVLTSNNSDYYAEQLLISVFSLKYHNPDMETIMVTDEETATNLSVRLPDLSKYIDSHKVVKVNKTNNNGYKSRWLKTNLRNIINGDFIFIDTDTIIIGDLSSVDDFNEEIGAVADLHQSTLATCRYIDFIRKTATLIGWKSIDLSRTYYNSGVLIVKDTDKTRLFYKKWHSLWEEGSAKGVRQDQPSLGCINQKLDLISSLPPKWNCQLLGNGMPFVGKALILHYFNSSKIDTIGETPFLFMENDILKQIKNENRINELLKDRIINWPSAFASQTDLISGLAITVYYSSIFKLMMRTLRHLPSLFKLIDYGCSLCLRSFTKIGSIVNRE